MEELWSFLEEIADSPGPMTYLVIALSACIEYVFPPFPGDTVTLFAGFLIGAREGWSFTWIFIAVNGGSMVGALADYAVGRWLATPGRRWRTRWPRLGAAVDRTVAGFERHGNLYLVVNRFLPSLRALFFVAAGAARLPIWKVVVFGLLSSILWNFLILIVGRQVGYEKDKLLAFLSDYSTAAWCLVAAVVVFLLARWFVRRRRGEE